MSDLKKKMKLMYSYLCFSDDLSAAIVVLFLGGGLTLVLLVGDHRKILEDRSAGN